MRNVSVILLPVFVVFFTILDIINKFFIFLYVSWFPEVVNVFIDKNMLKHLNSSQVDSFYNSVSTLVSNQVCPVEQFNNN